VSRHALPSTLTSTGRIAQTWTPGPAEVLTGCARWHEVHRRLRLRHGRVVAVWLAVAAWRHGVTLSGAAPAGPGAETAGGA
jgi:hypothetical protein